MNNKPVAELVLEQMAVGDASSLRVKWLMDGYPPVGTKLYTHQEKELNDGGEPVKNATYWKRQYNLMSTQNDNLKSGLYHANEQIKYLESHPVKELSDDVAKYHYNKGHEDGRKLAVGNATQEIHSLKKILNEILDNDGSRKIYNATKLLLARDLAEEVLRNERK